MSADFRQLVVWQKAMDLAVGVYALCARLPSQERFELSSQLRRAAVSVPSNIAEGQGRATPGEFRQLLGVARGSLLEIETQILLVERLGYVQPDATAPLLGAVDEIKRMLNALINRL